MKWYLKSKTFWGGLMVLAPVLSQLGGYDMSTEVIERLNTNLAELMQTVGAVLAVFGIRMADGKISISKPPKKA